MYPEETGNKFSKDSQTLQELLRPVFSLAVSIPCFSPIRTDPSKKLSTRMENVEQKIHFPPFSVNSI
uniref:Uncharacterized protein n=1 Tax=Caenorhabditis japonica TaxID=281687 RepID=A0A8R1E9A6_CAEJA